jgi:hypothetical protein
VRYMLLLYLADRADAGTPEHDAAFAAMVAFHRECSERGVLLAADPLAAPGTATTVRRRDGQAVRSSGPFAETREWLGGYFMLDCSEEEALELAELCPTCGHGSVEVRPLIEVSGR